MLMRRRFTIIRIRSRVHKTRTLRRHVSAGLASRRTCYKVIRVGAPWARAFRCVLTCTSLQPGTPPRRAASRPMRWWCKKAAILAPSPSPVWVGADCGLERI